jgi:hypothetical protein
MSARPKWIAELILLKPSRTMADATTAETGLCKYCMSWNVYGYWKGHACGSVAVHRVGEEVSCGAHVAQSIERQKHLTGVEHSVRGI